MIFLIWLRLANGSRVLRDYFIVTWALQQHVIYSSKD